MNSRAWLLAIAYLLGFFLLVSCKEDQSEDPKPPCTDSTNIDCPNYDTCLVQSPVNANFIVEYYFPTADVGWQEEKSHIWQGQVRFTALEIDANYKWYLGAEIISERSFVRNFNSVSSGTSVYPTLVVTKPPNLDCFPNDDGYDSLVKIFTVLNSCDYLIHNTWRGSWERSPLDTFEITIEMFTELGGDPDECTGIRLTNINGPNGGPSGQCVNDESLSSSVVKSQRHIQFLERSRTLEPCNAPFGYARVLEDNSTIYMEYRLKFDTDGDGSFGDEDYELEPRKFTGYALY